MNTTPVRAYDVRHDVPWIPVVYLDGKSATLPLQTALEHAHTIREIRTEPHIWAGLMRFLPGVTALIAREDPTADYTSWASSGFPREAIVTALDKVGDRWHLRHPDTPFLQDARIIPDDNVNSTEWLLLNPGASSKAWWGKPGDFTHPDAGSPARIAQGLVTSWFYSTGTVGRSAGYYTDTPDSGWRPRGTLTIGSKGLRVFWRGRTLAETLLANTMENHTRNDRRGSGNQPLWAIDGDTRPVAPLTASTWTGSAYLVRWAEDGTSIGVNVAGRRIHGLPLVAAEAKDGVRTTEQDLWRADPTVARAPVMKAGQETGEFRPIHPLHPTASALQWAAEWFAVDDTRNSARPMEPGLVEVSGADVVSIMVENPKAPDITHFTRVGEASAIAAPRARNRLISLTNTTLTPIRKSFYGAAFKALGKDLASRVTNELFARFSVEAEPLLDELIHADVFDDSLRSAFARAALDAFEKVMGPYTNSATLAGGTKAEGIAAARVYLTRNLLGDNPLHQAGEGTGALVHWALAVRDAAHSGHVRGVLARATTPSGAEAALKVPAIVKRVQHLPERQRAAAVTALGYIVREPRLRHTPVAPLGRALAVLAGGGTAGVLNAALTAPVEVVQRLMGNVVSRAGACGPVNLVEYVDLMAGWVDLDVKARSRYLVDFYTPAAHGDSARPERKDS